MIVVDTEGDLLSLTDTTDSNIISREIGDGTILELIPYFGEDLTLSILSNLSFVVALCEQLCNEPISPRSVSVMNMAINKLYEQKRTTPSMCEYLKILGISRDNPEINHICECIKSVCRPDAKKVSGISLKKKLNIMIYMQFHKLTSVRLIFSVFRIFFIKFRKIIQMALEHVYT